MSIADDVAVALGLHPAELWADWYADELEEASA
jgi:lambda repressor-like predicted transcriptional regulator